MKTVAVINNNTNTKISIPEDSRVIQYKSAFFPEIPVLPEPGKAVAAAIKNPIGSPPMKDLIKPGYRIAIAFDDPIKCSKVLQTMIPVVLEELNSVGIKDKDIILISANGTHCKWRPDELKRHLGENLYKRFRPSDWIEGQIINHDCTSGNSYIGMTELGDEVEHNRILFDSDFVIYIGTIYPFPLGGYPGQGVSIGLGSMRALNSLHSYDVYKTPAALHGDYDPDKNIYRKHKLEVHKTIEKALQKRIFYVDALLGGNEEVIDVYAGYVPELEKVEYAVADKYFKIDINQADIIITGLPYILDYDTSDNPACAANFAARALRGWRNKPLLKKNGVLIVLGRCLGNFCLRRPADPIAYNIYRDYFDAKQFYEHVDSFCNNSEFLFKYKYEYAYSPIHSIFMMANIDTLQKVSTHTVFVGDIHPGTIREIGAVPLRNFDEAFLYAKDIVGNSPEVVVLPSYFQDPKPIFNVL